jgi:crotonobetainyl-CoA:carnitine CoA-transferase CaiB-like acyl-CoA transferase
VVFYVNGHPEQAAVRPNLSIGDAISGIHAALGICLALLEQKTSSTGQVADVALYESMFNLMEAAGYPDMAQDQALSTWCAENDSTSILHILDINKVPGRPIYNAEDMANDEHFNAQGLLEEVS